jgi:hypothetical protein
MHQARAAPRQQSATTGRGRRGCRAARLPGAINGTASPSGRCRKTRQGARPCPWRQGTSSNTSRPRSRRSGRGRTPATSTPCDRSRSQTSEAKALRHGDMLASQIVWTPTIGQERVWRGIRVLLPRTATGRSSLLPRRRGTTRATTLTVEYGPTPRGSPSCCPARCSPPGGRRGRADLGRRQSCGDSGDELLDPVRAQYRECFPCGRARSGPNLLAACTSELTRTSPWPGLRQGYPKLGRSSEEPTSSAGPRPDRRAAFPGPWPPPTGWSGGDAGRRAPAAGFVNAHPWRTPVDALDRRARPMPWTSWSGRQRQSRPSRPVPRGTLELFSRRPRNWPGWVGEIGGYYQVGVLDGGKVLRSL